MVVKGQWYVPDSGDIVEGATAGTSIPLRGTSGAGFIGGVDGVGELGTVVPLGLPMPAVGAVTRGVGEAVGDGHFEQSSLPFPGRRMHLPALHPSWQELGLLMQYGGTGLVEPFTVPGPVGRGVGVGGTVVLGAAGETPHVPNFKLPGSGMQERQHGNPPIVLMLHRAPSTIHGPFIPVGPVVVPGPVGSGEGSLPTKKFLMTLLYVGGGVPVVPIVPVAPVVGEALVMGAGVLHIFKGDSGCDA